MFFLIQPPLYLPQSLGERGVVSLPKIGEGRTGLVHLTLLANLFRQQFQQLL